MSGYADGADLNAYPAATLIGWKFQGAIPYVGIGGGAGLPNKRLTAERWKDYQANRVDVPACFVELDINDADGGYAGGVANAQAAAADLASIGAKIQFVTAANDKTSWNTADVEYVRGFRDVFGKGRVGVYGFAPYLMAVHAAGYADLYHQAGAHPNVTGTKDFVHLWQDNTQQINGLDVNWIVNPLPRKVNAVGTYFKHDTTGQILILLENSDAIGVIAGDGTEKTVPDVVWTDLTTRYQRNADYLAKSIATGLLAGIQVTIGPKP